MVHRGERGRPMNDIKCVRFSSTKSGQIANEVPNRGVGLLAGAVRSSGKRHWTEPRSHEHQAIAPLRHSKPERREYAERIVVLAACQCVAKFSEWAPGADSLEARY